MVKNIELEMSMDNHPVLKHILNLGCKNQRDAAIAFQVYLDLVEVQVLWDVKYMYSSELDTVYFSAKENDSQDEPEIFIPLSASGVVSPEWLHKVQDILSPSKNRSVVLAFKDDDSTVVYYRVMEGMIQPDSPETLKSKKEAEECKRLMQSEIWRQRNILYQIAQQNNVSPPENM